MGRPAARKGDSHTCPRVTPGTPPVPHVGGPIIEGSSNVLIGGQPAATVSHACTCIGPPDQIQSGSPTVVINNKPAARITDVTAHGGLISTGCPTVIIGVDPFLEDIVAGVNPTNSVINCGNIIDAVRERLTGRNPEATAPDEMDGGFDEIGQRFNTNLRWGRSFQEAYEAVHEGGNGTTAIVGVAYSGGQGAHVLVMTNRNGTVAIMEGQDWGGDNSREVITNSARANQRYNPDGGSNIGYGIIP